MRRGEWLAEVHYDSINESSCGFSTLPLLRKGVRLFEPNRLERTFGSRFDTAVIRWHCREVRAQMKWRSAEQRVPLGESDATLATVAYLRRVGNCVK